MSRYVVNSNKWIILNKIFKSAQKPRTQHDEVVEKQVRISLVVLSIRFPYHDITISPPLHSHSFTISPSLHSHSFTISPSLHSHSFTISPSLHSHSFTISPSLHSHSFTISPSLHSHSFTISPSLHSHSFTISPSLHSHSFTISPSLHSHSFTISPPLHSHSFNISPSLHSHSLTISPSICNYNFFKALKSSAADWNSTWIDYLELKGQKVIEKNLGASLSTRTCETFTPVQVKFNVHLNIFESILCIINLNR